MITKQESDRKESLDNLSEFSELILNIIDFYSFVNEGAIDEEGIVGKAGLNTETKEWFQKTWRKK